MVVVGCSLGYVALNAIRRDLPVAAAPPTGGVRTVAPTPSGRPDPPVDLRPLLLTPPANSVTVPDEFSPDGTFVVEEAAAWLGYHPQDLRDLGYSSGAVIQWRTDTPDAQVEIAVLQFGAVGGPAFAAKVANDDGNSAVMNAMGGFSALPGSSVFTRTDADDNGYYQTVVVFPKASYFVEVVDWQKNKDTTYAEQFAVAQYAKLP
jgi:hypothetical protein